jgi:sulfur-oxidizing protein SoxX
MKVRATIAALFVTVAGAAQAEIAPDEVPFSDDGIAVPLTGAPGDPVAGREVLGDRAIGNCIACHAVTEMAQDVQFHGDVGPTLDGVADRWSEAEIRAIVVDPKRIYDGTIMPAFYKTSGYVRPGVAYTMEAAAEPLPPLLTAQQVEDVVAYLMTLKE